MTKSTDDLANELTRKKKRPKLASKDMLSSGSTLLNLATTGRPLGCFAKGRYYFVVGDSDSGKTFLTLTCLGEAANNPHFDEYRLIHDNPEDGALMDYEQFFGAKMARRIEPPRKDADGERLDSEVIEDFYYNVDDAIKVGKPFIYILDSMDSLSSRAEGEKFDKNKKLHRGGKKQLGTMTDDKAKQNSSKLRKLLSGIRRTKSILIIINQTRDNIGNPMSYDKSTTSGGRALKFYATFQLWSSPKGNINTKVNDITRQQGIYCLCKVKKNRITGRKREVTIPIYHSFGIDDVGSCVDFLLEEGHWKKKTGGIIVAKEFEYSATREKLIRYIEAEELERELRMLVAKVWNEIEEACAIKRKPRYE